MDNRRPSLVELRVLEGANLYFPRAAVKLTLDVTTLLDLPDAEARAVAAALGLPGSATRLAGHRARGSGSRCASRRAWYAGWPASPAPPGWRCAAARPPSCTAR